MKSLRIGKNMGIRLMNGHMRVSLSRCASEIPWGGPTMDSFF